MHFPRSTVLILVASVISASGAEVPYLRTSEKGEFLVQEIPKDPAPYLEDVTSTDNKFTCRFVTKSEVYDEVYEKLPDDFDSVPTCCKTWGLEKTGVDTHSWPLVNAEKNCHGGMIKTEQEWIDWPPNSTKDTSNIGRCLLDGYYKRFPVQMHMDSSDGTNRFEYVPACSAPPSCRRYGLEKMGEDNTSWPYVKADGTCWGGRKYTERELIDSFGTKSSYVGLCLLNGYYKRVDPETRKHETKLW